MTIRAASTDVRVPRVRPYLGRLWHDWRDQRRLARTHGLVPQILAQVPPIPGAPPRIEWVIQRSQWSGTGVAVLALGPRAQAPVAVLKAATTPAGIRGLRAQAEALARLHADRRLGDWRRLLPRTVAEGEVARWYYTLQEALPGVDAQEQVSDPEAQARRLSLAAATIRELHEQTREPAIAGEPFMAQAVERPIQLIRRAVRSQLPVRREDALTRLSAELRHALAGRKLRTGWIHGDFWLGNVLMSPDGDRVTGIVDWSMAAPHELALHDGLHLILHARQAAQGSELGDVVRAVLAGGQWEPRERALLEGEEPLLQMGAAGERAMVLLYWLRRLSSIFDQDRGQAQNPVWTAWNIDRVLECV